MAARKKNEGKKNRNEKKIKENKNSHRSTRSNSA
jgi:hypothetical protein